MADIDRARLRALAEKARDAEAAYLALPNTAPADDVLRLGRARNNASHALEHAASPDAILALLDALDAAERERDRLDAALRASCIDAREELREMGGGCSRAVAAEAERDALAALLQRARTALADMDRACDRDLIDAIDALDGAKGK